MSGPDFCVRHKNKKKTPKKLHANHSKNPLLHACGLCVYAFVCRSTTKLSGSAVRFAVSSDLD